MSHDKWRPRTSAVTVLSLVASALGCESAYQWQVQLRSRSEEVQPPLPRTLREAVGERPANMTQADTLGKQLVQLDADIREIDCIIGEQHLTKLECDREIVILQQQLKTYESKRTERLRAEQAVRQAKDRVERSSARYARKELSLSRANRAVQEREKEVQQTATVDDSAAARSRLDRARDSHSLARLDLADAASEQSHAEEEMNRAIDTLSRKESTDTLASSQPDISRRIQELKDKLNTDAAFQKEHEQRLSSLKREKNVAMSRAKQTGLVRDGERSDSVPNRPLTWRLVHDDDKTAYQFGRGYGHKAVESAVRDGVTMNDLSNGIAETDKSEDGDSVSMTVRVLRARHNHAVSGDVESKLRVDLNQCPQFVVSLAFPVGGKVNPRAERDLLSQWRPAPSDKSSLMLVVKLDPSIASAATVSGARPIKKYIVQQTDCSTLVKVILCRNADCDHKNESNCMMANVRRQQEAAVARGEARANEKIQCLESQVRTRGTNDGEEREEIGALEKLEKQFRLTDAIEESQAIYNGYLRVYFCNVAQLPHPFYVPRGTEFELRILRSEPSNPVTANNKPAAHANSQAAYISFYLSAAVDVDRFDRLFQQRLSYKAQSATWDEWGERWRDPKRYEQSEGYLGGGGFATAFEATVRLTVRRGEVP